MPKHKQVFCGSLAEASVLKAQHCSSFTSFWARFPGEQGHIAGVNPLLVYMTTCVEALVQKRQSRVQSRPHALMLPNTSAEILSSSRCQWHTSSWVSVTFRLKLSKCLLCETPDMALSNGLVGQAQLDPTHPRVPLVRDL